MKRILIALTIMFILIGCNPTTPEAPAQPPVVAAPSDTATAYVVTETALPTDVPTLEPTNTAMPDFNSIMLSVTGQGCIGYDGELYDMIVTSLYTEKGFVSCSVPAEFDANPIYDPFLISIDRKIDEFCHTAGTDPIEWRTDLVQVGDVTIDCKIYNEEILTVDGVKTYYDKVYRKVEYPQAGVNYFWFTNQGGCFLTVSDSHLDNCSPNLSYGIFRSLEGLDMTRISVNNHIYHAFMVNAYELVP